MSSKILFGLAAFLLGIITGIIWTTSGLWIILLISLIVFFWRHEIRLTIYIIIVALFLGYFGSTYEMSVFENKRTEIGERVGWDGHDHTITGEVVSLLSVSEYNRKYVVNVQTIDEKNILPFRVAFSIPANLSATPGDQIRALGKFNFPRDTVDYTAQKQLWNRRMIADFRSYTFTKTPPENYSIFVRMHEWFRERLGQLFPKEGEDVLAGILLGDRVNFSSEFSQDLKASGLTHIMVVSGGNVIMLIVFLSLFIRFFHPWIRIAIIAATVISFALLVGGDAPVWRAALMGIIGYGATLWGLKFSPLILPLSVATLLAIIHPVSIVYDIGLQLSFLSVIAIITWGKRFANYFRACGPFFSEAFALTLAATIGTLPVTLFYFSTLSLVGPLANIFAAPAIPIIMYGGILTLFASLFSSTLALWVGYIPWMMVTYLLEIIHFFGNLSWSQVTFEMGEYRGYFMVAALYIFTMAIILSFRKEKIRPRIVST